MNLSAVKKIQKRLQAGDVASHSISEKQAEAFKKQGNAHFRRRELPEALHCYGEVQNHLAQTRCNHFLCRLHSPHPGHLQKDSKSYHTCSTTWSHPRSTLLLDFSHLTRKQTTTMSLKLPFCPCVLETVQQYFTK